MTRKYQPSSGSERLDFMEAFCFQCAKDEEFRSDTGPGCPIAARTGLYLKHEAEYPSDWTYDENGAPTCTSFEEPRT